MELVRDFTSNNFHIPIKIIGTHDNPLFCASNIAEILNITNIRSTIQHFDETEKISQTFETCGGPQNVTFLTEKGLYKVLFRSRSPIAEQFQNWVYQVIKEIRLNGQYTLQKQLIAKDEEIKKRDEEILKKETELNNLIQETNEIKKAASIPAIYIYNSDFTKSPTDLKIGKTTNIHERIKQYKTQTAAHGRLECTIPVYCRDIVKFEDAIFEILQQFHSKGENFLMDPNEAKMIITNIVNIFNLTKMENPTERMNKTTRIFKFIDSVLNNTIEYATNQNSITTQTDLDDSKSYLPKAIIEENEITKNIEKFIQERCLIRADVESSTTDLEGAYRLWSGKAEKEAFHTVQKYFRLNFLPERLSIQDKNQVINGFKGIKVNAIEYKKSLVNSDEQNFIFHSCVFSPSGKVTTKLLTEYYKKWMKELKKPCTEENITKLLDYVNGYLIDQKYIISSNVWVDINNTGRGYYGIYLKGCEVNYKKSSTGRPVEKRDAKTNNLIATFETRAKAGASENVNPCIISRWIMNKVIVKDDYYFCDQKKL